METVQTLRKKGYKVKVMHRRRVVSGVTKNGKVIINLIPMRNIREDCLQDWVLSKGGETTVEVVDKNGQTFTGTAECSESDSFNRKRALKIAIGRIFKHLK